MTQSTPSNEPPRQETWHGPDYSVVVFGDISCPHGCGARLRACGVTPHGGITRWMCEGCHKVAMYTTQHQVKVLP